MKCTTFSDDLLLDLTRLVNRQLKAIPPGWMLTEAQVAQTIRAPADLWQVHYLDQDATFELETLCVVDQARLIAAAQWGYARQPESGSEDQAGVLFWIAAEPGNLEGATLLLETLVAHGRAAGYNKMATARYGFGVGWLGIPADWTEIIQALQAAGFGVCNCWTLLTSEVKIPEVSKPKSAESMQISWQVNDEALEMMLQLHTDGALVGECQAWGIPRNLADCEGYDDWVTIEWLGVEPAYQRQGIGRWLIAEQFRRQAQRGVKHAILWTESDNQPVFDLGDSLGFKAGPVCWEFTKD